MEDSVHDTVRRSTMMKLLLMKILGRKVQRLTTMKLSIDENFGEESSKIDYSNIIILIYMVWSGLYLLQILY